jgi:hypothetical protein
VRSCCCGQRRVAYLIQAVQDVLQRLGPFCSALRALAGDSTVWRGTDESRAPSAAAFCRTVSAAQGQRGRAGSGGCVGTGRHAWQLVAVKSVFAAGVEGSSSTAKRARGLRHSSGREGALQTLFWGRAGQWRRRGRANGLCCSSASYGMAGQPGTAAQLERRPPAAVR